MPERVTRRISDMEQVFVIIAVVVFWIFRGIAGGQRRGVPGQDPFEDLGGGAGGSRDIAGATRQQTLEAQERAIEALRRWEAKQGLSRREQGTAAPAATEAVPAASRTRAARPARIASRTTAGQKRRKAYADIAQMLDPGPSAGQASPHRQRFEVAPRAESEATSDRASSALWDAGVKEGDRHESAGAVAASRRERNKPGAAVAPVARSSRKSGLPKLESLPLAARAIVYAEILGRPGSLR